MSIGRILLLLAALAACACENEHDAVVHTAAGATDPWACDDASTTVEPLGGGEYRLAGCGQTRVYACNFAAPPSRCWTTDDAAK